MSKLAKLKAAQSLSDVATLLDFEPKGLSYILYKIPPATKYTTFEIPKRNGGTRTIHAPVGSLKLLQRRLSDLLQDCAQEIVEASKRKDRAAHGFKRGRSILTNAHQHRKRRWVFNLDLQDFFPSINFGRVRGLLMTNRDFALNERVSTVIAQIACHDNSLPQGSPCSPVFSNFVGQMLDMRLVSLASKAGCTYSRYADDLTFSTNKREFPSEIAVRSGPDGAAAHVWVAGSSLSRVIERTGFRLNPAKTRMMYRGSRQSVTGLVVNRTTNVRWDYRHDVRAMVNHLVRTGQFELLGMVERDGQRVLEKRPGTWDELHGRLGFIECVEDYRRTHFNDRSCCPDPRGPRPPATDRVYRDFLQYTTFFASTRPVILCEGPTDNIYLAQAIRKLAAEFPDLAEVLADGKIKWKVRLYKYNDSSTNRLLGLNDGGSSVLSKFIGRYAKDTHKFTGPGLANPIVVLYDNDTGSNDIKSAVKSVSKVAVTGTEQFVHVIKNLYAVGTPIAAGATESKIEDCFQPATKSIVLDGKTFSSDNGADSTKHYGKMVFAHRIVRQQADNIDFSGFLPLLARLVAAIKSHKPPAQ
jgi:RNA-directed DNA polymerase